MVQVETGFPSVRELRAYRAAVARVKRLQDGALVRVAFDGDEELERLAAAIVIAMQAAAEEGFPSRAQPTFTVEIRAPYGAAPPVMQGFVYCQMMGSSNNHQDGLVVSREVFDGLSSREQGRLWLAIRASFQMLAAAGYKITEIRVRMQEDSQLDRAFVYPATLTIAKA